MPGAYDEVRPPEPELIRDCVHCGFCLPTCPSYAVFEEEMDSPRGRIVLMRVGHEEGEEISGAMTTHLDRCLGCMACVTACPSGVQYDRLIERARPQVERHGPRTRRMRAWRGAIFALMTHPGRLRALVPFMAAADRLGLRERVGEAVPLAKLSPPVRLRDAVRAAARGDPGPGSEARHGGLHAGLHPARALRGCQRRHGAGAGGRGIRGPRAPPARAAAARCSFTPAWRTRPGSSPGRSSTPTRATTLCSSTWPDAVR